MKKYIRSSRALSGTIENTCERCKMIPTGYWVGSGGRHITSYARVDKKEDKFRQYSMDRHRRFWIETEDDWEDWMDEYYDDYNE